MQSIALLFATQATANCLVAGIPAAARAVHNLAADHETAPLRKYVIAVPGGWQPSRWCVEEMARLAPDIAIVLADANELAEPKHIGALNGECVAAGQPGPSVTSLTDAIETASARSEAEHLAMLRSAGNAIIAATGKPADGIVSRYLNRPISRLITRQALRFAGVTPMHGTFAAAVTGIAMAICLFAGGDAGLLSGALLFQAASVIDGVDGEIARATFRSSRRGAMLDTLTDAATNLAFIAGVSANLWQQGYSHAPLAGAAGIVLLALGLTLLGMRSRAVGGPFTFDAVKHNFRAQPSSFKAWLAMVTTRDFYAAAFALLIILDCAAEALFAFSAAVASWLAVTVTVLYRTRGNPGERRALQA